VIVIIGILSAVAVPKFASMKQNAEAASVVKVASDAFASIPAAYVNIVDLDGNKTAATVLLNDLVSINGKGWTVSDVAGAATAKTAIFTDPAGTAPTNNVATLTLTPSTRNATLVFNCAGFVDASTRLKCWKNVNGNEATTTTPTAADGNVSF